MAFDAKTFVAGLPNLPGVYRMLGKQGDALYVGKARDLKKRVASYFQKQAQSPRIEMMLSQVASMEVTATRSEAEALLLENNLIKSLNPRYNILFRDDKSYPYLMVTGHQYPRLGFHRGAKDKKHRYFGPFPHAYAVRESIQLLQRVFRLRTCEDTVFENRSRPCLLHQIQRCTAPCTGKIAPEPYAEDVANAVLFLEGREDDVIKRLTEKMQRASEDKRYEQAALYRDQVRALARVQARQYVESHRGVDADVVACVIERGIACVNLVMIRGGRHVGDRSFFPANAEGAEPGEVIAAFLEQHYLEQPLPGLVVANAPVDIEGLEVLNPSHGERRVWLDMAHKNAELAIAQRVRDRTTQETRMAALREVLGLPEGANRVECFDISHTMGEATVASCVVYDQQQMQKSEYRRFNIRGITPGDDYAAMRQVLERRYEKVTAEGGKVPDLVLIDGGKGQVGVARGVLADLGLHQLCVVGVAKGPERKPGMEELIIESENRSLQLAPSHPGLHLIQAIRDEAHRFAIVGHRARRGKARTTSMLNEIPGIGAKRRQALIEHFGGLRGVQAAAIDDIAKVEGISRPLAERIYRHLHLITLSRIILIPLIIGLYYLPFEWLSDHEKNLAATIVFILAAATDWLDGYLARRLNQMSAFGEFLDPVADKLIVAGALIVLVWLQRVDMLVALIIIGREIAISALREWMAKVGQAKSVAVAFIGKLKTVSQMVAIPLLLYHEELMLGLPDAQWLGTVLINIAAVLTAASMLYYLRKALPHARVGG
jgi:excinuclease ABC subunit C